MIKLSLLLNLPLNDVHIFADSINQLSLKWTNIKRNNYTQHFMSFQVYVCFIVCRDTLCWKKVFCKREICSCKQPWIFDTVKDKHKTSITELWLFHVLDISTMYFLLSPCCSLYCTEAGFCFFCKQPFVLSHSQVFL